MNVLNPYVRQFLVGWITVLDSVPDIDMLGFLPDFLDGNASLTFQVYYLLRWQFSNLLFVTPAGLFNMLSDSSHEIRQQADAALSEFLQEIKNSPVSPSSLKLLVYLYQSLNSEMQCNICILPDEYPFNNFVFIYTTKLHFSFFGYASNADLQP